MRFREGQYWQLLTCFGNPFDIWVQDSPEYPKVLAV
jgi:hypothetical protein